MFANFWYALAFSDEITVAPSRHRVLAQDLVLWRDRRGHVHALSDLCVHRGARLSAGWLDDRVLPGSGPLGRRGAERDAGRDDVQG